MPRFKFITASGPVPPRRAPAPDIDQMNAEIEQGYLDERSTG